MLIGYNNDVDYRGKKFHIQTEDHGRKDPRIESQIFHQGQILDTEIVPYESVLEEQDGEEVDHKLKSMMWAAHKGLYRKLMSGEYDKRVGLEPVEDPSGEVEAPAPDEFEPGQDRVPTAARKIEEQGEEAVEQFHQNQARKHVDLDSLKDHLSGVSGDEGNEEAEEAEQETREPAAQAVATAEASGAGASGLGGAAGDSSSDSFGANGGGEPTADQLLQEEEESRSGIPDGGEHAGDDADEQAASERGDERQESSAVTATAELPGRDASSGDVPATEASPKAPRKDMMDDTDDIALSDQPAWRGCRPAQGSVDVVPLVEEFIDN